MKLIIIFIDSLLDNTGGCVVKAVVLSEAVDELFSIFVVVVGAEVVDEGISIGSWGFGFLGENPCEFLPNGLGTRTWIGKRALGIYLEEKHTWARGGGGGF